ncbi:MAG TPA: DUF4157 domain-containing protein, partial [Pyrinomonadaceae bacterium]|nr:DUF4157 domain-containing protein [Pyrinomonadaceae bacterium]
MTGYTRRAAHVEAPAPHGRAVVLQRKCVCGQHTIGGERCDKCRKQPDVKLQRWAEGAAVEEIPAVVHDTLRSNGQPLDAETRAFMEPRFGHDFTGVRVHTDALAADSAAAVNAAAYTVGEHIVFREGRYAPRTRDGAGLLAHELTHVVQQRGAAPPASGSLTIDPSPVSEQQADDNARLVATGAVAAIAPAGPSLQRKLQVKGPGKTIPNPGGKGLKQTNAATVQNYLGELCHGGGAKVDAGTGEVT